MKLSFAILIFISSIIIIGCSTSTSGDSIVGFYDPGSLGEDVSDLNDTKQFTFPGIDGGAETCPAGKTCNSIIYQGNGYVGIAVNDSHDASPDFKLMVYWQADTIPTSVNLSDTEYTAKIWKGTTVSTSSGGSGNLVLTISPGGNSTIQTITFGGDIGVGTHTIQNGNSIVAQTYISTE